MSQPNGRRNAAQYKPGRWPVSNQDLYNELQDVKLMLGQLLKQHPALVVNRVTGGIDANIIRDTDFLRIEREINQKEQHG